MVEVKQRVPEHRQERKRDDDNIRSTKNYLGLKCSNNMEKRYL